jgi:hypothetical protein
MRKRKGVHGFATVCEKAASVILSSKTPIKKVRHRSICMPYAVSQEPLPGWDYYFCAPPILYLF